MVSKKDLSASVDMLWEETRILRLMVKALQPQAEPLLAQTRYYERPAGAAVVPPSQWPHLYVQCPSGSCDEDHCNTCQQPEADPRHEMGKQDAARMKPQRGSTLTRTLDEYEKAACGATEEELEAIGAEWAKLAMTLKKPGECANTITELAEGWGP